LLRWRKPSVGEFTGVETGKRADALDLCRQSKATFLTAKINRLARNVYCVSGLFETGVDFVAADVLQANKVTIQMHAVMAEWERDPISARTKAALAAARMMGRSRSNVRWSLS
jgi:DNA invertase Pin-like site-specific DNA recombinase